MEASEGVRSDRVQPPLRLIVADGHAELRNRIRGLIAPLDDIELVGEADNFKETEALVRELHPDLLLMDARMPGALSLDKTGRMKKDHPSLLVILLALFDVEEYRAAARKTGAAGFLIKKQLGRSLIPALRSLRNRKKADLKPSGQNTME
jgi:DNA-binding NarL/FixJ family response regulator